MVLLYGFALGTACYSIAWLLVPFFEADWEEEKE